MAAYVALMCYGAWTDARTLRIPNTLSLALLAAFLPMAVIADIGLEALTWHLGSGVLVLAIGFALFAIGLFGGGDAKLMAAAAVWVGWTQLLYFAFAVVLVGGVLSLAVILLRKGLGLWPDWLVQGAEGLFTPNKAVPYGIAITIGALITLPRMDVLPPSWLEVARFIAG
jgi:prepilin peptidase CpaA